MQDVRTDMLQVALPVPIRKTFIYYPPKGCASEACQVGVRVRVPFGRRRLIGIVWEVVSKTDFPEDQIKTAEALLDETPLLTGPIHKLCEWMSRYYHHPIGEVVACALPHLLRTGHATRADPPMAICITEAGAQADHGLVGKRTPRQAALLQYLIAVGGRASATQLRKAGFSTPLHKRLLDRRYVMLEAQPLDRIEPIKPSIQQADFTLTQAQRVAIEAIQATQAFTVFVLDGVTGSGKTEVYLHAMASVLQRGASALMLVPEIGLTPQMMQRIQDRFKGYSVLILHSGLTDRERHAGWLRAWRGSVDIVVGTRSAVFVPLARLELVIVDESHDTAYGQLSGCRYSGRDVAVMRAKMTDCPIVLGSATPSFESWHHVRSGRYQHLSLPKRAGTSQLPVFHVIDMRRRKAWHGLSKPLLEAIDQHVAAGQQVLLFLNRRGYAPVRLCHACGWQARCQHCDARMTLHDKRAHLRCHHCGAIQTILTQCPSCQSVELLNVGIGTEQLEQALKTRYPMLPVTRIDRDTIRAAKQFSTLLERMQHVQCQLLIGTQMLAKGHHFPQVTMVGIVDIDYGLYSSDFRALERMAQLILQVAGRAGRGEKAGEAYLQTHAPDHAGLQILLRKGYHAFMDYGLQLREQAQLPPFAYLAVFHIEATLESKAKEAVMRLITWIKRENLLQGVQYLGPMPAVMLKRAKYYRMQLWLSSRHRLTLHRLLHTILLNWGAIKMPSRVRCHLDVDPVHGD